MKQLTRKMEQAAENLEFETAAHLRDRLAAIRRITEKQKVVSAKVEEQDVIALAQSGLEGAAACFEVFRFSGGAAV